MPRTVGARDKKKRTMSPASLAQLPQKRAGHISGTLRINARSADYRWLERMSPLERGNIITQARRRHDDPRSDLLS